MRTSSKRGATALSASTRSSAAAPKSYSEDALAAGSSSSSSDDSETAPGSNLAAKKKAKKVAAASLRRGYTSGYADPLKKYEGTFKSPPVRAPPAAIVTRVLDLAKHAPTRGPAAEVTRTYRFADRPEFRPNLSPEEVMRAGSFGGTYFRPIASAVSGETYTAAQAMADLPAAWLKGMPAASLSSATYDKEVNTFGVPCGGSLDMWESSGWINPVDPYGWFQWYYRFFQGRRCSDDDRQIGRWLKRAGPKGRFRNPLIRKGAAARTTFDDAKISPVIRQTLQHWGYNLTQADHDKYCKLKGWM
jgi:hypothetical protein